MFLDERCSNKRLNYEIVFRVPSYGDGKHLFRFAINSMTCNPVCVINGVLTFTHESIQCWDYIDKNETEKDAISFLVQQMQRTQDVDFTVDDAMIYGFGQDGKVKSKYGCMKTILQSFRIFDETESRFEIEATFACDGYRELAV